MKKSFQAWLPSMAAMVFSMAFLKSLPGLLSTTVVHVSQQATQAGFGSGILLCLLMAIIGLLIIVIQKVYSKHQ